MKSKAYFTFINRRFNLYEFNDGMQKIGKADNQLFPVISFLK